MSSPPIPHLQDLNSLSVKEKVEAIQQYIEDFEYNYSGKPFLKLKKNGGADHIEASAINLIKMSLPIQCVEAVFLGCYLTAAIESIERIPLSFKSTFRGSTHRHIVLAVRHEGNWGAIGISRRENLMDKKIEFKTLADLLRDFKLSYEECFHTLLTVYVGLPVPRQFIFSKPIMWRAIKIRIFNSDESLIDEIVATFCENMERRKDEYYKIENGNPSFDSRK